MIDYRKYRVSLKIAQELKEADYPQDQSEWYWIYVEESNKEYFLGHIEGEGVYSNNKTDYAAPDGDELGEMLPARLRLVDDDYWLIIHKGKDGYFWEIRYRAYSQGTRNYLKIIQGDTFANACALMYIWLTENGHLETIRIRISRGGR